MPDLIARGEEGVKRWENEKCAVCMRSNEDCPLIAAMIEHKIESFAGFHVFCCNLYDPDTNHPLYIETDAEKRLVHYETQIARLRESYARANHQFSG